VKIRQHGNKAIWKYEIWKYGNKATRQAENMEIWKYGNKAR
jgi:hypothetical protein